MRHVHARNDDRSDEQLAILRERVVRSQSLIVYGISTGPALADMQPFHGTASMFLREVCVCASLQYYSLGDRNALNSLTHSLIRYIPQNDALAWGCCCILYRETPKGAAHFVSRPERALLTAAHRTTVGDVLPCACEIYASLFPFLPPAPHVARKYRRYS